MTPLRFAKSLSMSLALAAAVAQGLGCAGARADEGGPPMVLKRTGFLFAGGHLDPSIPGAPMVGQIYAEYMIPARQTHPYPIIMVPGGAQDGTNFTGTAEGKEGWAQYFVRRGYTVYVVDQVARARSPYWGQPFGPTLPPNIDAFNQRFVNMQRYKAWPSAHLHSQFPGTGEPDDPYFLALAATQVPGLASFAEQQALNADALAALLDKTGPAILLTHSQAGAFNWPTADRRPGLIKAMVAVEPSGPPVHDIAYLGAPDWFKDADAVKVSGLGDIPLQYDPPLAAGEQLAVTRQDKPEGEGLVRCWLQKAPARKLRNMGGVAVGIFTAEASYHAPYDHCTSEWLTQAGVKNQHIYLADEGIHGNGHMMMVEKNSDRIAAVIYAWLDKTIPATSPEPVRTSKKGRKPL